MPLSPLAWDRKGRKSQKSSSTVEVFSHLESAQCSMYNLQFPKLNVLDWGLSGLESPRCDKTTSLAAPRLVTFSTFLIFNIKLSLHLKSWTDFQNFRQRRQTSYYQNTIKYSIHSHWLTDLLVRPCYGPWGAQEQLRRCVPLFCIFWCCFFQWWFGQAVVAFSRQHVSLPYGLLLTLP